MNLGLRETVILVQAGIEYHINRIMLHRFGTDSFESERINSKIMSLNDTGVINDTLRQDLIQIARIKHLFSHSINVDKVKFERMLGDIKKGRASEGTLRQRFLAAAKPSYYAISRCDGGHAGQVQVSETP